MACTAGEANSACKYFCSSTREFSPSYAQYCLSRALAAAQFYVSARGGPRCTDLLPASNFLQQGFSKLQIPVYEEGQHVSMERYTKNEIRLHEAMMKWIEYGVIKLGELSTTPKTRFNTAREALINSIYENSSP